MSFVVYKFIIELTKITCRHSQWSCLRPFVGIHINSRAYICYFLASEFRVKLLNAAIVHQFS